VGRGRGVRTQWLKTKPKRTHVTHIFWGLLLGVRRKTTTDIIMKISYHNILYHMTNGVKVGCVNTDIIWYNILWRNVWKCPDPLFFFSSHVSPFEKIGTIKSQNITTHPKKPVDCDSLNHVNPPLGCAPHLLAYNGPTPNGQMDGWMGGLSLHIWSILFIIHVCVFIHVDVCVCVCVCVNECIVREVGGWPSCVITCEIDCLKILCVPTPIDPWFGWLLIKSRVGGELFFF